MTEESPMQPSELLKDLMANKLTFETDTITKLFAEKADKSALGVLDMNFDEMLSPLLLDAGDKLLGSEEDDDIISKVKKLIAPILEFIGHSDFPEMEDTSEISIPVMGETETQARVEGVQRDVTEQSTRTINDPSVKNQGVKVDSSKATTPKTASETNVENMMIAISEPPANRSQIA